jgi:hypothetical protein
MAHEGSGGACIFFLNSLVVLSCSMSFPVVSLVYVESWFRLVQDVTCGKHSGRQWQKKETE